jgi:hypothetical protein
MNSNKATTKRETAQLKMGKGFEYLNKLLQRIHINGQQAHEKCSTPLIIKC